VRRQHRILIVDDDMTLLSSLARAAVDAGLAVSTALDGSEALRICSTDPPDAILLDVNMPSSDGRDVLKVLKRDPKTAKIPVFVHSARTSHHDRIVALELGAEEYFEKPFDLTLLFRRVVSSIEKLGQGG
jgi:DNA-binding response OmpR family regulator